MTSVSPFDVCTVYFAFEDRPNEGKIRPVVVSSVTTDQVYFVASK